MDYPGKSTFNSIYDHIKAFDLMPSLVVDGVQQIGNDPSDIWEAKEKGSVDAMIKAYEIIRNSAVAQSPTLSSELMCQLHQFAMSHKPDVNPGEWRNTNVFFLINEINSTLAGRQEILDKFQLAFFSKPLNQMGMNERIECRGVDLKLLEAYKNTLLENFNKDIVENTDKEAQLTTIAKFLGCFNRAHFYKDGNARTAYLILNYLLKQIGLFPALLTDPNRLDCYSIQECVKEIKVGLANTYQLIINNTSVQFTDITNMGQNKSEDICTGTLKSGLEQLLTQLNINPEDGFYFKTMEDGEQRKIVFRLILVDGNEEIDREIEELNLGGLGLQM